MMSDAALADLKARNPCDQVAGKWVKLRKHGRKLIGACPICGGGTIRGTRFECGADGWVCAVCQDGGDVLKLVMKVENLDFPGAVAWLGGAQEIDPVTAASREQERAIASAKAEIDNNQFRERERGKVYEMWLRGLEPAGTPVEDYLHLRGLQLPPGCRLRCIIDMPYCAGGAIDAPVAHRGPAMLAPIVDATGRFRALHTTWIDLSRPNGKALIKDPETGAELPAKKVRGSKAGNRIELLAVKDPAQLIIGEGIETVLSVWLALAGRDLTHTAFWSAVDLGNLGGRAAETVPHPGLKTAGGRAQRVPGPVPDPESIVIAIPETVTDLVLLGDGDSDPFKTHCALARAAARYAAPGRTVRVAWAPDGFDFNDLLQEPGGPDRVVAIVDAAPIEAREIPDCAFRNKPRPLRAVPLVAVADFDRNSRSSRAGSSGGKNLPPKSEGGAGGDDLNRRLAWLPQTDLGNVERFVARYGHVLKWCAASGWHFYDRKRWSRKGADTYVLRAEHATVRAIQDEAKVVSEEAIALVPLLAMARQPSDGSVVDFDAVRAKKRAAKEAASARKKRRDGLAELAKSLRAWGRKSETANKMSLAKRARANMEVQHEQFDADPWRINVQNGTLIVRRPANVPEGEPLIVLAPHDPADLITKICPVEYRPDAQCPLFDKFFARVQPAPRQQRFLKQWHGYSLTGDAEEQKLAIYWGSTGQNGKGTLIETAAFVAGDYAESVPIETFLQSTVQRSGGQATPDLAKLPGVRYLRTGEPEKGARISEALVKRTTGGDPIDARNLNKEFFTFFAQFKLTIACNYKPRIGGTDGGIWRRPILVPWSVQIPENERDTHLKAKLRAEGAGILNRLLDGLRDYLENGLVLGEEIAAATAKYRRDSDAVDRFLEQCTVTDPAGRVQSSVLHETYLAWAKCNDGATYSNKGFTGILDDRGLDRIQNNVMFFVGIRLIKNVSDFVDHEGKPLTGGGGETAATPHDDEFTA